MTRAGESTVSWAGNREAFGRVAVQPGSSTTMLLRFPGQWEDGVGGAVYNFTRIYSPGLGRYLEVDTIGLDGGENIFVYAGSNPVKAVDEEGKAFWVPVIIAAAVCGRIAITLVKVRQNQVKACDFIYAAYKRACGLPSSCKESDSCEVLRAKSVAAEACAAGRTTYLNAGCCDLRPSGTGIPGRIKHHPSRNPDAAECRRTHEDQANQRWRSLQKCNETIIDNRCSCDSC